MISFHEKDATEGDGGVHSEMSGFAQVQGARRQKGGEYVRICKHFPATKQGSNRAKGTFLDGRKIKETAP
jgi:hypothetical protein